MREKAYPPAAQPRSLLPGPGRPVLTEPFPAAPGQPALIMQGTVTGLTVSVDPFPIPASHNALRLHVGRKFSRCRVY